MNFTTIIDNINFDNNKKLFNKKLNLLKLMYTHKNNQAYLSLILLDNQNAREYIISILKEYIPNLYVFNTDNQEFNLKKFTNKIKTTPTVISNLDKFYLNLSLEKEITINEAKELFYQAINL